MRSENGRVAVWLVVLAGAVSLAVALVCWRVYSHAAEAASAKVAQRERAAALYALQQLDSRWVDAAALARATPRVGLAGPVAAMQSIRRETAAVQSSGCAAAARDALSLSMEPLIAAFTSFMAQTISHDEFEAAEVAAEQGKAGYIRLADSCAHPGG
jgi:hypothetical protein